MMSNIFKFLVTLFLLTFYVNYAKTKTNPDIFSIIDENTLQRKLEFTVNDSKSSESFLAQNGSKLLHYLSLVSDEMNELDQIEENKFKEDPISLASAFIELSPDEVKFHELIFDDFENFKKAPVRLETLIPDGSDPNTIKIIYESKVNEIVLSGLAEINSQKYDFVLNISDLTLREEHEKTPTTGGKIATKSILEKLTFKKFTMLIVLTEGNKFIKSPNKPILRRLADSWLVSIINVVNNRYVQPKIMEQSQLYYKNYKNSFLEAVCSSVLQSFNASLPISSLEDKSLRTEDSEYDKYIFRDISFNNFSKISNCSSGSFSVEIERNSCPHDNYYSHALNFAFTYSSNRKFTHPVIVWTLRKYKEEERNRYNGYDASKVTDENLTSIIKYWSAKLTISTDKNGKKTDDDMKVSIDFELKNTGSTKLDDLSNRFLERLRKEMATPLRDQLNSLLTSSLN